MGIQPLDEPADVPVVIDALVGYGLEGPLRGKAAELAAWSTDRTIVSLDFPSGHGHAGAVEPDATLTLALPKDGLLDVRPLYLADLGLPRSLWTAMGLDVGPVFKDGRVIEVV
jgi:NAD(P)H-hydrate epimerase